MIDPETSPLAVALKEFPLCQQIILFLIENESAMDTVKGIAACWVGCDEVAVQAALDRLLICGAVIAHTLSSGTLYGLTPNQAIRAWLSGSLRSPSAVGRNAVGHQHQVGQPESETNLYRQDAKAANGLSN